MFDLALLGVVAIVGVASTIFVAVSTAYFYYCMASIVKQFSLNGCNLKSFYKDVKRHIIDSLLFTTGAVVNILGVFIVIAYFIGLLITQMNISI